MAENKKYITDQVYEELFHMLMDGGYAPGDRIPSENELKQRFNVSRNTVRAALNRMNVLGIVETRQGDGTYLRDVGNNIYLNSFVPAFLTNSDDLMGLMTFRRGIEITSARLAAIHATEEDLREMERYFEYIATSEISNTRYAHATNTFHACVARASRNEIVARTLETIGWIVTNRMADFLRYKPDVADSSYYHHMIYKCIQHHKPEEAAYMMDRHMALLIDRVEDYLRYVKENPQSVRTQAQTESRIEYGFHKKEKTRYERHPQDDEGCRFDGVR